MLPIYLFINYIVQLEALIRYKLAIKAADANTDADADVDANLL